MHADPGWGPRPQPAALVAIVLMHVGAGWLLMQTPSLRQAVEHLASLSVTIVSAERPIFIDGMRDPAFYERDSFNWDRLEVLRGSASMLFGRGSTGGAVNQVSKRPGLLTQHEISVTLGSGSYLRAVGDFNIHTGEDAALRINAMANVADNWGAKIDRRGIAPSYRWGIGRRDEFEVGLYYLQNDNGIHYGLPWLTPGTSGGNWLWPTDPKNYYGMASDIASSGTSQAQANHVHRFGGGRELKTALRVAE